MKYSKHMYSLWSPEIRQNQREIFVKVSIHMTQFNDLLESIALTVKRLKNQPE